MQPNTPELQAMWQTCATEPDAVKCLEAVIKYREGACLNSVELPWGLDRRVLEEIKTLRMTLREIRAIASQVAGTGVEYLGRLMRISELASKALGKTND